MEKKQIKMQEQIQYRIEKILRYPYLDFGSSTRVIENI